jgi:hypothetical protein
MIRSVIEHVDEIHTPRQAPIPITFQLSSTTRVDESWLSSRLGGFGAPRDVTVVARNPAGQVHFRVVLRAAFPSAWAREPGTGRVTELTLTPTRLEILTLDDSVAPVLPAARPRLIVAGSNAEMAAATGGAVVIDNTGQQSPAQPLALTLVRPVPAVVSLLQDTLDSNTIILERRLAAQAPWLLINTFQSASVIDVTLFDPDSSLSKGGFVVAWPSFALQPGSIR